MTTSRRCARYLRVSRHEQREDLQDDETAELIERRGWQLVSTFTDHGVSGTRERRPGLDHGLAHGRGTEHTVVAERARNYLDDIAGRVRVVTGRGRREFTHSYSLLAAFDANVDAVREAADMIERGEADRAVAAATRLPAETIEAIHAFPRTLIQHAEKLTINQYGRAFEVDHLRRLLRDARNVVADAPDEVDPPVSTPARRRSRRSQP